MSENRALLAIHELFSGYKNCLVLKNITLQLDSGSAITIVGRNGAGKSTLLKSILSQAKKDKGSVVFNNHDITSLDYTTWY
jgi:branched-chain amino acid transport system ATP-binding protein